MRTISTRKALKMLREFGLEAKSISQKADWYHDQPRAIVYRKNDKDLFLVTAINGQVEAQVIEETVGKF